MASAPPILDAYLNQQLERVWALAEERPWYASVVFQSAMAALGTIWFHPGLLFGHPMGLFLLWVFFLMCRTLFVAYLEFIAKPEPHFYANLRRIVEFTSLATLYIEARAYQACPYDCGWGGYGSDRGECIQTCFFKQVVTALSYHLIVACLCTGVFVTVKLKRS